MSDGFDDIDEVVDRCGRVNVKGYCFYHGQDLKRAVNGCGLMLAFGDLDGDKNAKLKIGKLIAATLEAHGFKIEWNGDSETRINIPKFDWKHRRSV